MQETRRQSMPSAAAFRHTLRASPPGLVITVTGTESRENRSRGTGPARRSVTAMPMERTLFFLFRISMGIVRSCLFSRF